MTKYTAKMKHDKDTITKLSLTQYSTFEFGKKMTRYVIAIGLIVYGMYADRSMYTPMICLVLGCLLVANVNLRPRVRAGKVIEQLHGSFPSSDYEFIPAGFYDGKGSELIPYGKIIRLIEDRQYMYLYISRESAYMIDKSTVSGGTLDAFKAYIEAKTDLKWSAATSLLNFSIRSFRRNTDDYQGPRL